jgi:hypothetical protein
MFSIILFIHPYCNLKKNSAHDIYNKRELKNSIEEALSLKEADFIDSRQYEQKN